MTPPWWRSLLLFLGIGLLLGWVYLPALTEHYFYHDDVNFFLKTHAQPYPKSYHFSLAIGRFVGAPIYAGYGRLIEHIDDLKVIRLLCFAQLVLCALLIYRLLVRHRWPGSVAAGLSTLIVSLPPFQVLVTQAGYAFQMSGVFMALIAVSLVDRIPYQGPLRKILLCWQTWLGSLFFLAAIATHPSTAMFYWCGAASIFIREKMDSWQQMIRKGSIIFGVGIVTMLVYAIVLKVTRHLHPPADFGFYNPYDLTADAWGKARWFLSEPLANALNLWNIFPRPGITWLSGLTLGVTIIVCGILTERRAWLQTLFKGLILLSCLVLSFSTNLLAVSDAAFYRCCIGLGTLILIYFWAAGLKLVDALPEIARVPVRLLLIVTILAMGLWTARDTLIRFRVYPSQVETEYVVDTMRDRDVFRFQRIHIYQPDRKQLLNRYDEFGGPTASFRGDLVGLVIGSIREYTRDHYRIEHIQYDFRKKTASLVLTDSSDHQFAYHVNITHGSKSSPIYGTVPTLILDIPQLYTRNGPLHYLIKHH